MVAKITTDHRSAEQMLMELADRSGRSPRMVIATTPPLLMITRC